MNSFLTLGCSGRLINGCLKPPIKVVEKNQYGLGLLEIRAESVSTLTTKRFAVVTGANKGIVFEVVRQLASKQVVVLNVIAPESIASLADFVKLKFGKLDILVEVWSMLTNAGIGGVVVDVEAFKAIAHAAHDLIVVPNEQLEMESKKKKSVGFQEKVDEEISAPRTPVQ
ncbi:hypothetical protein QQ045_010517 [Rhodiola kirilowii]